MNNPKKIFLYTFFMCLASCGQKTLSPQDTITTIVSSPLQSLNPLHTTDADSQHVNELVHSGLVVVGTNLLPTPYLAKSFRIINDKTLEFTLREGCLFSTGEPLRVEDVEASLHFFTDKSSRAAIAESFKHIIAFKKTGPLSFRFELDKVTPSLLSDTSLLKILPPSAIAAGSTATVLPGIAPYKITSFDAREIKLERYDSKCLPLAASPKIIIKTVRDDLSRYLKLQRGEVDVVYNEMNFRKIRTIQTDKNSKLRVALAPGINHSYMGINTTNPKLADIRVRRAIALSLDLPSILKFKSAGGTTQARNLVADTNFYANLGVSRVNRDLEKARQLLDEAGYFNGKNSKPALELTLKTTTNSIAVENAQVLASQLADSGIKAEPRAYEWGIFYRDVKKHNVELYLLSWVGVTDPKIYFDIFHSGEISRNNRSGYKNPEMDKYLELGQSVLDPQRRRAAFLKVQELAARDLPIIGLWYPENAIVYRNEVSGVSLFPNGSWRSFLAMHKVPHD